MLDCVGGNKRTAYLQHWTHLYSRTAAQALLTNKNKMKILSLFVSMKLLVTCGFCLPL